MPERQIIADTGPLVAFLVEEDVHHAWAVEQFKRLPMPFLTCEPVLAEACHLVRRVPRGPRKFFELLGTGVVTVAFNLMAERQSVEKLVRKYENVPMSLADACLVRMAELHAGTSVLTVDGDFKIYRKHGRRQIAVIMPGERH